MAEWNYYKSGMKRFGTIKYNKRKKIGCKLKLGENRRKLSTLNPDEYSRYISLRYDHMNNRLCNEKKLLYLRLKLKFENASN